VFDRDGAGAGASRRSAGLHLPRGSSDRTRRMSAYSHAYYADLKRAHPRLPIHPIAATVVAGPGDDPINNYLPQAAPAPIETSPAATSATGPPATSATSPAATPTITPTLPAGSRAWRISGAHHCDVYQLAQALTAQLRPQVTFAEGVTVTALEPKADGVTVHCGTGAQLTVGQVILAPGPWLNAPAWRDLVAPLGLRVKRVVALHIARRPSPDDEAILFDSDDAFLLPLADRGHWLFSYASREWDVDPDKPEGLTATEFTAARDRLRRYAPALANDVGACHGGRVFCDAYSPDREPIVRPLDPEGRIVFAGAACGSGYRLAPAIAAEAVDLIAHLNEGVPGDRQYV
jgi:D-arginine dehydrogenase